MVGYTRVCVRGDLRTGTRRSASKLAMRTHLHQHGERVNGNVFENAVWCIHGNATENAPNAFQPQYAIEHVPTTDVPAKERGLYDYRTRTTAA